MPVALSPHYVVRIIPPTPPGWPMDVDADVTIQRIVFTLNLLADGSPDASYFYECECGRAGIPSFRSKFIPNETQALMREHAELWHAKGQHP